MLAARATRIAVSPTMKVAAEAMALKAKGVDVVDLGAGEPDFPTPKHIGDAAKAAIDANFTKYTTNSGTDELKKAIVWRYTTDYGVDYATNEVIVTAGGKQALYNAVMVLFGDGRRGHHPHAGMADAGRADQARRRHAGDRAHARRKTVSRCSRRTVPRRADAAHPRHHPEFAGQSDRRADGGGRARGARRPNVRRRGIWILLDLCYEKLIYDPTPHNLPAVLVETMRDHTVLCGSASKAYAMTGWRCGWTLAPKEVVAACNALQSHSTSNVCSITQKAVSRRTDRAAGLRHRHARRVPRAPRSARRVAGRRAAHPAGQAGGRVLPVPGRHRVPVAGRRAHVGGAGAVAARRARASR